MADLKIWNWITTFHKVESADLRLEENTFSRLYLSRIGEREVSTSDLFKYVYKFCYIQLFFRNSICTFTNYKYFRTIYK